MNITDSIAIYTSSQKIVGMSFMILGALLIGVFFCLVFQQTLASQLWQGFKISALVCGLLIAAGGIGYVSFCNKTQAELFSMYEKQPIQLVQFEKEQTYIKMVQQNTNRLREDYLKYLNHRLQAA